jgi:hypothetical protein
MKKILLLIFFCSILLNLCACSYFEPTPEPDVETIITTGMWSSGHRSIPRPVGDSFQWEEGYWIRFAPDGTFEGGYANAAGNPDDSDYTITLEDAWGYWRLDGDYVVVTSVNNRFMMRLRYDDGILRWGAEEASAFYQII